MIQSAVDAFGSMPHVVFSASIRSVSRQLTMPMIQVACWFTGASADAVSGWRWICGDASHWIRSISHLLVTFVSPLIHLQSEPAYADALLDQQPNLRHLAYRLALSQALQQDHTSRSSCYCPNAAVLVLLPRCEAKPKSAQLGCVLPPAFLQVHAAATFWRLLAQAMWGCESSVYNKLNRTLHHARYTYKLINFPKMGFFGCYMYHIIGICTLHSVSNPTLIRTLTSTLHFKTFENRGNAV